MPDANLEPSVVTALRIMKAAIRLAVEDHKGEDRAEAAQDVLSREGAPTHSDAVVMADDIARYLRSLVGPRLESLPRA